MISEAVASSLKNESFNKQKYSMYKVIDVFLIAILDISNRG